MDADPVPVQIMRVELAPRLTRPAWATAPTYPLLRPGTEFVSPSLLERPSDEFFRDARGHLWIAEADLVARAGSVSV